MENLLSLQQSHPVFGRYALNSRKAVLNDYSCLEGVTARNMCDIYRNCKELIERRSGQEKSDHIVLKYRK